MSGGGAGDPGTIRIRQKQRFSIMLLSESCKGNFQEGRHRGSTFRAILDEADLTEGDFSECDFGVHQ